MHVIAISPLEVVGRMALALLLGAVVGAERERNERAAGLRTHALVCMGSSLIMLVSAYAFADFATISSVRMDPGRIAAQVVSGIGFLGAGTIILRREVVRGLTTAANLWVVAAIGLAAGAGMYLAAVAGSVGALAILVFLKRVEGLLFYRSQTLRVRVHPEDGQLDAIRAAFQRSGVRLRALRLRAGRKEGEEQVRLDCFTAPPQSMVHLVEALRAVPGLIAVEGNVFGQPSDDEDDDGLGRDGGRATWNRTR
jgi:putative Mg2+ transporter-C (MgtC) family protein